VFGNPLTGDGYKTRAEWVIKFDDGVVATIYDWKQYHCPVHEVTTWNIGGHDKDVVYRIADILTLNDLQERYA
jgi:hypothetical protein